TGFNRQAMVRRLDELLLEISIKKLEMRRLRTQQSDPSDQFRISDRLTALREEIREFEEERKHLVMYLKKKGDGEITVSKRIYPNCDLILGGMYAEVDPHVMAQTFYLKDGEFKKLSKPSAARIHARETAHRCGFPLVITV